MNPSNLIRLWHGLLKPVDKVWKYKSNFSKMALFSKNINMGLKKLKYCKYSHKIWILDDKILIFLKKKKHICVSDDVIFLNGFSQYLNSNFSYQIIQI